VRDGRLSGGGQGMQRAGVLLAEMAACAHADVERHWTF
jgi:hypothetical protein